MTSAENQRKRTRVAVAVAALALIISLGANGAAYRTAQIQTRDVHQNHEALCAFKIDLARRVKSGDDYLIAHPDKVILGVPRAVIANSIKNEKATLDSLAALHCE